MGKQTWLLCAEMIWIATRLLRVTVKYEMYEERGNWNDRIDSAENDNRYNQDDDNTFVLSSIERHLRSGWRGL
jgi:hypothetical protein